MNKTSMPKGQPVVSKEVREQVLKRIREDGVKSLDESFYMGVARRLPDAAVSVIDSMMPNNLGKPFGELRAMV